jgi:carboxyl-terminal processing protease
MPLHASFAAALVTAGLLAAEQGATDATSRISIEDRVYVASRLYSSIQQYFNHWQETGRADFDRSYREYLDEILRSDDRRAFDLSTIRLFARLHNGHTWFSDRWLQESYGDALGFYAEPIEGQWIVTRSDLHELHVGDSIVEVDGKPIEEFYQQDRAYLADSNERTERLDLFGSSFLFPKKFDVTLSDQRTVSIIRQSDAARSKPAETVDGHWLEPEKFAYIQVRSFGGVSAEGAAIAAVRKFKDANGLIIDVRGNPGGFGNPPTELQAALMKGPHRSWRESVGHLSFLGRAPSEIVSSGEAPPPQHGAEPGIFQGPIVILIDSGCASYCEDFVMPFKDSHRATLVGDTTAGTYSQTRFIQFDNGMMANIAATREAFPDGTQFEGVGILPDVAVARRIDDIRAHRDAALARAVEVLEKSLR